MTSAEKEVIARYRDSDDSYKFEFLWQGHAVNFDRKKCEMVGSFLNRCTVSIGKKVQSASKKRKHEEMNDPKAASSSSQIAVKMLDSTGTPLPTDMSLEQALKMTTSFDVQGDHLPLRINPPTVNKLETFGKPIVGAPLVASVSCTNCSKTDFDFTWLLNAGADATAAPEELGRGRILWVPERAFGHSLTLKAESSVGVRGSLKLDITEQVKGDWPDRRLDDFASGMPPVTANIRLVTFNILALAYTKSSKATQEMFPYCAPQHLAMEYRQPLVGRELERLNADVICLQECSYHAYWKFFVPLFGDRFHHHVTLKAGRISEGCALMVRKSAFDVIEIRDVRFQQVLRSHTAFKEILRELVAKWDDFIDGVLSHMTTIFQIAALRHVSTGEVVIVANTHLFFHPKARHIRLLMLNCLLHLAHELAGQHLGADGRLPRFILGGDLNCTPDCGAVQLLLKGEVPSDHPDWDFAKEFRWARDSEDLTGGGGTAVVFDDATEARPPPPAVGDDEVGVKVEPLPANQCQPGLGVKLVNPFGALTDAYADSPLPFTNFMSMFHGTLDHIVFAGSFRVRRVLGGVSHEQLAPLGGLPNQIYPSDHLAIAADLELTAEA